MITKEEYSVEFKSMFREYDIRGRVNKEELCPGNVYKIVKAYCKYLKRRNITRAVCGYDREEFTHTAVAAQIAQGGADAGMGIWSAASLYDLDFLPVCVEQYDLLIPDHAWDNPMLQKLLEILAGSRFREKRMQMGGYQLENPGRVRQHF